MKTLTQRKPETKKEISKELKSKRSNTKLYWYIVAIYRETKKRWYWDVTEGEWIGKPTRDNCAFVDWDYAYNLGIIYGMTPSDLKKNDVYIVHAGIAEFINIDSSAEPYPCKKFIRRS